MMKKVRTAGTKVLALLLAVCMMIGLVPVNGLAAGTTTEKSATETNVQKVLDYAVQMKNANVKSDYANGGFTWDTENRETSWRYFNGLMMDAFLMTGIKELAEYADLFYDNNIVKNSDNTVTIKNYGSGELDSVESARALFDLFQSSDVSKYKSAIQYVYSDLEKQIAYTNCGGNYLHKQNADGTPGKGWETWNSALDGLYMAQPFLMECAKAIDEGELNLTDKEGNSVTSAAIYEAVFNRFNWVAQNMRVQVSGTENYLYHHGWKNTAEGNGYFWSRGLGWYAMAQVDVIELMPDGTMKDTMIEQLTTFFDDMLKYQDAETGMWYNVVNRGADLSKNVLETSGSSMMAYALIKAYQKGYVSENYGTAGLKAFNGVVANKVEGTAGSYLVKDTYLKSGVGSTDEYYCTQGYTVDEAKGTGALIMAAAVAKDVSVNLVTEEIPVEGNGNLSSGNTSNNTDAVQSSVSKSGTLQNVTYTKDTDGVDSGEKYLIVNRGTIGEGYALMNNNNSQTPGKQSVTISNKGKTATISANASACEWTFTKENELYKIQNDKNYLRLGEEKKILNTSTSYRTFTVRKNTSKDCYKIYYSQGQHLIYENDSWQSVKEDISTDTTHSRVWLYKKIISGNSETVTLTVTPKSATINVNDVISLASIVKVGSSNANSSEITWSSDNTGIATVDENGKVTGIAGGKVNITVTLNRANGKDLVTPISVNVPVTVIAKEVSNRVLSGNGACTVNKGTEPDFSNIKYTVSYTDGTSSVYTVGNGLTVTNYNKDRVGTYTAKIYWNGEVVGNVDVIVEGNPYEGLPNATKYPEYPADGAVRINKFAESEDFNSTGVTKVELDVAGISVKQGVDVVLVVDVSNSMGWTDDWFVGMTPEEVKAATDANKIPKGTAETTTDKLDSAMAAAKEFSNILLANNTDDWTTNNSLSFVTFAGFDKQNTNETDTTSPDGKARFIDSVQTVFTNVQSAGTANTVFDNTKFTSYKDGEAIKYTLQIGQSNGQTVRGENRGNTNYDYAFGEADTAVRQLKAKYKEETKQDYSKSGRQTVVVFMTDGAPSHYNNMRADGGSHNDKLYGQTDKSYPAVTTASWIDTPVANKYAQKLAAQNVSLYAVGFDLDHGGFSGKSWTQDELRPVLASLTGNNTVPVELAENSDALKLFYSELANQLKYSGTNAKVTDVIKSDFTLQMGNFGIGDNKNSTSTIEVTEYDLYTKKDTTDNSLIGTRKTTAPKKLEVVTFNADGTVATSDQIGDTNIMKTENGVTTITAKYFTYIKNADGVESFTWNVGDITEEELALSYYAYLKGSMEGNASSGVYDTNESAILEYVDINGCYATKEYPVPQVSWGSAITEIEYYLVNENGEPVNIIGEVIPFANRIILPRTAAMTRTFRWNQSFTVNAIAYVPDGYEMYNPKATYTVTAYSGQQGTDSLTVNDTKTITGTNEISTKRVDENVNCAKTRVAFGVIDKGELETLDYKFNPDQVVVDYGKAIKINVLENDTAVIPAGYEAEVSGFTAFVEGMNTGQKKSNPGAGSFNGVSGTFSKSDANTVVYTLNNMLSTVEKIFVVVKVTDTANTQDYYYMYQELDVIPATIMYYETDFAENVFAFNGTGWNHKAYVADTTGADTLQDTKAIGTDTYGYDSSYTNDAGFSNYYSSHVVGQGNAVTTVNFDFIGTGFDLISMTGANEGFIRVSVYSDANKTKREKAITVCNKSESNLNLYQIPVVSIEGLTHGKHYVEIGVTEPNDSLTGANAALNNKGHFHFDAIRIFDPIDVAVKSNATGDAKTAYTAYSKDGEADYTLTEVRDKLLSQGAFDSSAEVDGVTFVDRNKSSVDITTYKKIGPKNEVYLTSTEDESQMIGFELTYQGSIPKSIDIGAKSANGLSASLCVNVYTSIDDIDPYLVKEVEINTSTAQFIDLFEENEKTISGAYGTGKSIFITVENANMDPDSILSITDLKVAYGENESGTTRLVSSPAMAARMHELADNGSIVSTPDEAVNYDIISAEFTTESVKKGKTAYMTVVSSSNVETLTVQNSAGNQLKITTSAEVNTEGNKVWAVSFKAPTTGTQIFTVAGYGVDGTSGASKSATIKVTRK